MLFFLVRQNYTVLAIIMLSMMASMNVSGQSVGIGTSQPNIHAVLDISSARHNQGFLMPRLTSDARLSMPLGKEDVGLMVFDIDQPGIFYWDGVQWVGSNDDGGLVPALTFDLPTSVLSIENGNMVDLSSLVNNPEDELINSIELQNNQLTVSEAGAVKSLDMGLLELNGDIAGTLQSAKVQAIHGYPVNATDPQPGDKLVFDGTSWSLESVTPVATGPEYYSVAPGDFVALYKDDVAVERNNSLIFSSDNSFVTIRHNDIGQMLMAPVHLPQGAKVNELTAHYFDDHTPNLTISFVEVPIGGPMNILDQATSNENRPEKSTRVLSPNATIDNLNFTYAVLVEMDVTSETRNPDDDAEQGIYGVVIQYTLP